MRSWPVAIAIVVGALLAASSVHAEPVVGIDEDPEPPPTLPSMRDAMHDYFAGELAEGFVFAGAGAAGLGAGTTAAIAAKDGFYKGAAWPLLGFGAIQLTAGVVLLFRTAGQIAERDAMLEHVYERDAFYSLERPRMERVRTEFRWLAIAETALVVVGAGLAAYGGATREHAFVGFGTSLAFESALMLALDGRASDRADFYASALSR